MGKQRPRPRPARGSTDFTDARVGLYVRVSLADPRNPNGRDKSTTDQEADGRHWIDQQGARLVEVYSDEGISASRFTKKARAEFARLVADLAAGKLEVLWFWEQSRLSRKQTEFHQLLDLCRDRGVLWVKQNTVIDPGNASDVLTSGIMASVDAMASEQTSDRVLRGKRHSAHAGRPPGRNLYGYRRLYDPLTRQLTSVVPDEHDPNGHPVDDSPAAVVREMFERIAAGESIRTVRLDLSDRGIRTPTGNRQWGATTISQMLRNPAYNGQRVHQEKILNKVATMWPPLVSEDVFEAVQVILDDPGRSKKRHGTAKWLLTGVLTCAACGSKMYQHRSGPATRGNRAPLYCCINRGCTGIKVSVADEFVQLQVVGWLSKPEVYALLTAIDNSEAVTHARAEVERLRGELKRWQHLAGLGKVDADGYMNATEGLSDRIAAAEQRVADLTPDRVVAEYAGEDAPEKWAAASVEVRRQIIQRVAEIRVRPVGRSRYRRVEDRFEWRWLIPPGTDWIVPSAAGLDVTPKQAETLLALSEHGSLLWTEVRELVGLADRSQGQHIYRKLLDRGWVERVPAPTGYGGHHTYRLSLTDDGRRVAANLNGHA